MDGRMAWAAAFALAAACGDGSGPGSSKGGQSEKLPPVEQGDFAYWSVEQGLSPGIWDVSADEGGNVYVAAGDAVYARRRGDREFRRFDPAAAGLTRNCDASGTVACPIVSVAGAAPGVAIVGLRGIGTDGDSDPDWQIDSGGADVVAFDGTALARQRHVQIAGPPHQMCMDHATPPCSIGDATYEQGRRKVRQVLRIAVNHDSGAVQYGDAWFAGTHGTFSLLVASPERRGWVDHTPTFPGTEARQYVWEHDHPAMYAPATIGGTRRWALLTGESTAIAIDPMTGDPWASNETRTAAKRGYGARGDGWDLPLWPPYAASQLDSWLDVWPDPHPADLWSGGYDALDPAYADLVSSLSFCDDGTLWIASSVHGLARRAPSGTISYVDLPPDLGNDASAVACDPSDGSLWVGFGWGGFGRLRSGTWWTVPATAPRFAVKSPVRSIQIDRWTSPRIVHIAFSDSRFGPGGVASYDGP
jgi:hypothetical protein